MVCSNFSGLNCAAERLTRLINNVLDFARHERSQAPSEKQRFDLIEMLGRLWSSHAVHLQEAGFTTDWVKGEVGFTSIVEQVIVQAKAVGLTIVWSGVVAYVSYKIVDLTVGLRVPEEQEREGLFLTHGHDQFVERQRATSQRIRPGGIVG